MSAKHHLVPQFYLRNFANRRNQVVLVDRDDPSRAFRRSVRNACAEVGFYRIEVDDLDREEDRATHDPELVENLLNGFETSAAPAIYKLVNGYRDFCSQHDWYHLINYIALQTVRGVRWREDVNASASHELRMHLAESLSNDEIRGWLVEEGRPARNKDIAGFRRDLLSERGPRVEAPQAVLIQEGLRMALSDIAERLADRMHWEFIEPKRVPMLTADEPVCWWAPGDGPVGFGNAKVVWLPLSRGLILQLRDADETNETLGLPTQQSDDGPDELASIVNREVAAQAERWILHHPDDEPLHQVDIPPRTVWRTEVIDVRQEGNVVRERYVHRRLPPRRSGRVG
ncbi:DUF4238 domain-containing protein [Rhodococcus opacus]|nr:DUF4238 domain-containing protein [Rhodococcus opacus]